MKTREPKKRYRCSDCGSVQPSTGRCGKCGCSELKALSAQPWSPESMSKAAKIYTGIFVGWALIFPFLLPIILKLSHTYQ